jgi:hypothetical protein
MLSGCETWALKDTHKLCTNDYGITRWHHQHKGIKMETVLNDLGLDRIEQIFNARILRFLERIASLKDGSLLRRIACSQAEKMENYKLASQERHSRPWVRTLQESWLIPKDDNSASMKFWAESFAVEKQAPSSHEIWKFNV